MNRPVIIRKYHIILDWDHTCSWPGAEEIGAPLPGVYPDTEDVIRDLFFRGHRLSILSHGDQDIQDAKFKHQPFVRCFQGRVRIVPTPEAKKNGIKELLDLVPECPPPQTIVVGDRFFEIVYGNMLGCLTARIRREGKWEKYSILEPAEAAEKPSYTFRNLRELRALVLKLSKS